MKDRTDNNTSRNCCAWFACLVVIACFVCFDLFFDKLTPQPTPSQKFAVMILGDWESVTGNRTLSLDLEGHKATISLNKANGDTIKSTGTWQANESVVTVEVTGAAGAFSMRLEMISGDIVNFLTPTPIGSALLKDSYTQISEPASGPD
jgi:hypothetical protein